MEFVLTTIVLIADPCDLVTESTQLKSNGRCLLRKL